MAKPMILSEETGPTHFTFAHQIGVQTDDDIQHASLSEVLWRSWFSPVHRSCAFHIRVLFEESDQFQ